MAPSPPLEGRVAAHANSESSSDATAFASADERAVQAALESVPREVLAHIVDVHCHPTDSNMAMTLDAMRDIPIRLCAMATRQSDQRLVADLACAYPESVVPCFGFHPWFTHWISLEPAVSKDAHYRALFLPSSPPPKQDLTDAFDRLLPFLPDPIPLADVLTDLRTNLTAFPHAMLGEVGLDRACRIPFSHPADPPFAAGAADNAPSSARELSPFTIPLAHQLAVLEAQLAVAATLARPVSLHSVKAQQATRELLDRMRAAHGARWLAISVDLHSCGLSAQTWAEISKTHPNVYLSLSTVINTRSPAHRALIAACTPDHILVESDFHDVRLSTAYTWDMLRTVAAVKGWRVEDAWDYDDEGEEDEYGHKETWGAVRRLEENWRAFRRGGHKPYVRRKERRSHAIEEWEANESD